MSVALQDRDLGTTPQFTGIYNGNNMKAIKYKKYGSPDVLTIVDVDTPQPKDDEILVRVYATTVTSGDVRLRASNFPLVALLPVRLMFGVFKPRKQILGHELSGVIEAVGKDVTQFKVGDGVLATPTMLSTGSYAEYICIPQERKKGFLCLKPNNLTFYEAAALLVGGVTAMFLLNKAKISKGLRVLIYGASGSVGSYAVQIATAMGASVVAVCSGSSSNMVESFGVDRIVDYKTEDFTGLEDQFDVVLDAVGKISKAEVKAILKPSASFVSVQSLTNPTQEHLRQLLELVEEQKVRPYIDKTFPFTEIIAAHEYVDTGRKKGNVVIAFAEDE
ncbi:Alcohol dehydrogenase [Thalassocella blandensis]|nr:Alcohol dehydrogenase [Thalassocella blandensis]